MPRGKAVTKHDFMAQKIIIQEAQEAEQWPKAVKCSDIYPEDSKGAEYIVCIRDGKNGEAPWMSLERARVHGCIFQKDLPAGIPGLGYAYLFKDQESALRWWLDPQPIESPKTLTFGELNVGEWFVCSGEIQVKIPPMARISDSMELNSMTTYGYGGWLLDDTIVTRCTVTKE